MFQGETVGVYGGLKIYVFADSDGAQWIILELCIVLNFRHQFYQILIYYNCNQVKSLFPMSHIKFNIIYILNQI
jgi:hypothetical protein